LRKLRDSRGNDPGGKVEVFASIVQKFGLDPLPHHKEPAYCPAKRPNLSGKYPFILINGSRKSFYSAPKDTASPDDGAILL